MRRHTSVVQTPIVLSLEIFMQSVYIYHIHLPLSPAYVPEAGVRPGAAGLLIDIECSRVRDSSWMCLTSLVTTQIGVELAAVQRKLPDRDVVGLQLYSARTFHVNMFPRIYKGGQVPPQNTSTPKT